MAHNQEWYYVADGSADPEGPFSIRDLDVKFRTGEITSQVHVWKEGLAEWKKAGEVGEIKRVFESRFLDFEVDESLPARKQSIIEEAEDITNKAAQELINLSAEPI